MKTGQVDTGQRCFAFYGKAEPAASRSKASPQRKKPATPPPEPKYQALQASLRDLKAKHAELGKEKRVRDSLLKSRTDHVKILEKEVRSLKSRCDALLLQTMLLRRVGEDMNIPA